MTEMPAGADGGPEIDRCYSSGRTGPGRGLAGMAIGGGFERRICTQISVRTFGGRAWAVGSIVFFFGISLWVGRYRYVGYLGWLLVCRQLHCCYARMEKSCVGTARKGRDALVLPQSVQSPPWAAKKKVTRADVSTWEVPGMYAV